MGWKGAENNGHLLLKATSTEVVDLSYYGMFLFEMISLLPLVESLHRLICCCGSQGTMCPYYVCCVSQNNM